MLIKYKEFLLEKKIGKMSTKIELDIDIDIIKTKHAAERQDFKGRNLEGEDQRYISNKEMVDFVLFFKKEISNAISDGKIYNDTVFNLKSLRRSLAMSVVAKELKPKYWRLIIITVFRESEINKFKVSEKGLLFEK